MIEKEKKEGEEAKKDEKEKEEVKSEVEQLFADDKNQTKVFPTLSPCKNYLVYLSGTGITHTFYKDIVICKKEGNTWL